MAEAARHPPPSHLVRLGPGAGHLSLPAQGDPGGGQDLRPQQFLRGAADGLRGVAVSGRRGAKSPGATSHRPAGSPLSGAQTQSSRLAREVPRPRGLGGEPGPVGGNISLRPQTAAELGQRTPLPPSLHLGQDTGRGSVLSERPGAGPESQIFPHCGPGPRHAGPAQDLGRLRPRQPRPQLQAGPGRGRVRPPGEHLPQRAGGQRPGVPAVVGAVSRNLLGPP